MEVVKRNMYSILCGIVAIIAVVLVFYPLGGGFESLQGKLNESASDCSSINSLLGKEHTAPDVDINNAEQRKLGKFPTPKVIQAGEAAVVNALDFDSAEAAIPEGQIVQIAVEDIGRQGGIGNRGRITRQVGAKGKPRE